MTDRISMRIRTYSAWLELQVKSRAAYWKDLATITVLAAYFYIFMEWVFFVTMPSFMSLMSAFSKLEIFILSGWGFGLLCLAALGAFILVDLLGIIAHIARITRYWGIMLPSIILSALALLLIDNFTYTIFKFGISTTTGIMRGVYAALFVLLTVFTYFRMLRTFGISHPDPVKRQISNRWSYAALGLLLLSTALGLANLNYSNLRAGESNTQPQPASGLPNIILLGSDGVNADNLSAYGYTRDTTPRLAELAESSLVAENAFTNAGNTAGSVISIMTSKLPTQTRVLYPPDILTGFNSYQHLPGILNNLGYKTVEYGVPFYIDAYNFNLQNGFDVVNNRTVSMGKLGNIGRELGFENEIYFLTRLTWRISDRILHIFFIREMQNPFAIVTQPVPNISDQAKVDQMLSLFDQARDPLFIHIHLLGTHGGYYSPPVRVYSKGESQPEPWLTDFYDDTLLAFDAFVGQVIDKLKADGLYNNTILIIYTDHNQEFKVDGRIPLIIHFPGGQHAGRITQNAENIDIAPTILDFLGQPQPKWMEGISLLKGSAIDPRLIFSAGTTKVKPNEQDISFLDPALNKPPFYQFSYLSVIDCQKWYLFDLTTYQWTWGNVTGYVNPCGPQQLLSAEQIKQAAYQRLATDGFDISSLP